MSGQDKVAEILNSLHQHIENEKKILDEENKKLLEQGKKKFQEIIIQEKSHIAPKSYFRENTNFRKWLNVKYVWKYLKFVLHKIKRFFLTQLQKLKNYKSKNNQSAR